MLLLNNVARLITINGPQEKTFDDDHKLLDVLPGKEYRLMPAGEAVEVPDELCKCKFVETLIEEGSLINKSPAGEAVDDGVKSDDSEKALGKMNKDELTDTAVAMGITVEESMTKSDIVAAILSTQ